MALCLRGWAGCTDSLRCFLDVTGAVCGCHEQNASTRNIFERKPDPQRRVSFTFAWLTDGDNYVCVNEKFNTKIRRLDVNASRQRSAINCHLPINTPRSFSKLSAYVWVFLNVGKATKNRWLIPFPRRVRLSCFPLQIIESHKPTPPLSKSSRDDAASSNLIWFRNSSNHLFKLKKQVLFSYAFTFMTLIWGKGGEIGGMTCSKGL